MNGMQVHDQLRCTSGEKGHAGASANIENLCVSVHYFPEWYMLSVVCFSWHPVLISFPLTHYCPVCAPASSFHQPVGLSRALSQHHHQSLSIHSVWVPKTWKQESNKDSGETSVISTVDAVQ